VKTISSKELLVILLSAAICGALMFLALTIQSYFNLSQAIMKFAACLLLLMISGALLWKYNSLPLPLKRRLIACCVSFSILAILFGIKVFYVDIDIPYYLVVGLLLGPVLLTMLLERSHKS